MLYLLRVLCVCALGVVSSVGCSRGFPGFEDPCEGVVCPDDGNECTGEYCARSELTVPLEEGICKSTLLTGTECDFGGLPGLCKDGQCKESPCGVCDDDNLCTQDYCSYVDERCVFAPVQCVNVFFFCAEEGCDPLVGCTAVEDGTPCMNGADRLGEDLRCQAGVCVGLCDPASEETLQCPTREDLLCCPGMNTCSRNCELEAQP